MSDYIIGDVENLRKIYPEAKGIAAEKQLSALDQHCRNFIAHSPFLVLGTDGDVSPKGDDPGFVHVVDDNTIVIPDRKGNNRMDSLQNILDNPSVGLLFMIPGVDETLRVNGKAELTIDPDILEPFALNGRAPTSAIVVRVFEEGRAALLRLRWPERTFIAQRRSNVRIYGAARRRWRRGRFRRPGACLPTNLAATRHPWKKPYDDHIQGDLAEEGRT